MAKTGRPSDALRHRFQRILEQSHADEKFRTILATTKDKNSFLKAYEMAYDRAYGKAPQFTEMELSGGISPISNEVLERIAGDSENGSKVEGGE